MTALDSSRRQALLDLLRNGAAYDAKRKQRFRILSRMLMQDVADELLLDPADYDIRWNAGGIAVSGTTTLHHKCFAAYTSDYVPGDGPIFLRSVQGRHDHVGGRNRWVHLENLRDEGHMALVEIAREILNSPPEARP